MKHTLWCLILVIVVCVTSCVPHKDLVYLQNKEQALDSTATNINAQPRSYRVQIGDILNIRVKALDQDKVQIFNPIGDENLSASGQEQAYFDGFTVDVHGNIRIPILGEINVLGYTTEEIRVLLEKKLLEEQFKETANVFVTVKLSGLRFTATGELGSPGSVVLYQDKVNIFEAIANAGEITQVGNRKQVMIIRQYPQGQKIHKLDLTDVNVMNSPYYYIQHNDMIYVKPLKQKSWGAGITGRDSFTALVSVIGVIATTILLIERI